MCIILPVNMYCDNQELHLVLFLMRGLSSKHIELDYHVVLKKVNSGAC